MFVGHYAPSFAFRRFGGVPLWVLFMAAQFVDVLFALLVLLGVEKVRIVEGFTASSPLDLYYMPYSHGLLPSVGWALVAGLLGALLWGRRGGVAIGVCVLGHWFLDLPVHVADLPIVGDAYKVGFGLWDRPLVAFLLEAAALLGGAAIYARHAANRLPIWLFCLLMLAIQMSNVFMPPPPGPRAFAVMALSSYVAFAAMAWFVERRWGQAPNR
ncbi:MAG: hypothetical protein AAF436_04900 [Myxococcota bacterium]